MTQLAPLAVGVPLLSAALLAFAHWLLTRLAADLLAIAASAATAVMTLLLLVHVRSGLSVYWFGGWHPRGGVAIGIDFAVGPIGAGLALFVSLLMVIALVYSAIHIDVASPYYQVLMLTFMAGMVGFCLSGDLFNMFVFFELMSVSAVALIAYKVHERAALEGGLNFAVINTIGSFLFLLGIGLIYAHTGALNLAQIGKVLGRTGPDRVVVISFALIVSALLIKAAVVPFHFWLNDAYAVALAPVCILLAGAMSEIGLYGLGRLWFAAYGAALGASTGLLRAVFVAIGILTAMWGAAMALVEDHMKRMLAFITISFVGVFLVGIGLLTAEGVAGTAVYVVADGFGKALLFACVGILQHRRGKVGQFRLHGRARELRGTGILFAVGGLLIASLPPFGPFLGKSMIEDAAVKVGYGFVPPFIVLASALAGAAVLRAGARVFLGWGTVSPGEQDPADDETEPETLAAEDRTPATMFGAAVVLLAGTIGVGVWFGFADLAASAAQRFVDLSGYQSAVYGGAEHAVQASSNSPEWFDYLYFGGAAALAIAVAALGLWSNRAGRIGARLTSAASAAITPIRRLHTGRVGDYVAALVLGVGVLGAIMAVTLL